MSYADILSPPLHMFVYSLFLCRRGEASVCLPEQQPPSSTLAELLFCLQLDRRCLSQRCPLWSARQKLREAVVFVYARPYSVYGKRRGCLRAIRVAAVAKGWWVAAKPPPCLLCTANGLVDGPDCLPATRRAESAWNFCLFSLRACLPLARVPTQLFTRS